MNVSKIDYIFCSDVILNILFWEGYELKSLEAREKINGNWLRKLKKAEIQSSSGENWKPTQYTLQNLATVWKFTAPVFLDSGIKVSDYQEKQVESACEEFNPQSCSLSHTSGPFPVAVW